jgi:hypothetical protein
VLNVKGGGSSGGYHQIGGVTLKPGIDNVSLLDNRTGGAFGGAAGSHHIRFTDGHFGDHDTSPTTTAKIDVDRQAGAQSTVELVGCRGMQALAGRVTLKNANSSNDVVLIVIDCDIADVDDLINANSSNCIAHGRDNWTFADGAVMDSNYPP